MKKGIYMDNAATSFPKPPEVIEAMVRFMTEVGANPGRSSYDRAMEASRMVDSVREKAAKLFNISNPGRIVFTLNATESLNTVIYGFLKPSDHVIITQMEHNSVLRPMRYLEESIGLDVSVVPCDRMGFLDPDDVRKSLRPNTSLVCINHASNVCGTIQDIQAVRDMTGEIPILLDAAQTAGELDIDVEKLGIDFMAFAGHKALLGPQGVGGLYIRDGLQLQPLKRGGTGSFSESMEQPEVLPDAFESGTRNNVGIAGLGAALDFLIETGMDTIRDHWKSLLKTFIDGLEGVAGVVLYGPLDVEKQCPIISATFDKALPDGLELSFGGCGGRAIPATFDTLYPQEAGAILRDDYEIAVRVGLHCAPLAHKALGTFPDGTVRFSIGFFNTAEEVGIAIDAIRTLAEKPGVV